MRSCMLSLLSNFNPRAPRGARPAAEESLLRRREFQSTCPARGTTMAAPAASSGVSNFNPRAPRGARPCFLLLRFQFQVYFNPRAPRGARLSPLEICTKTKHISIHVPREGHDASCRSNRRQDQISIHVPREGHDFTLLSLSLSLLHFNPRAPRGARLKEPPELTKRTKFQSTCPARGTTFRIPARCPLH